jgi:hypothetical protein
MAMGMAVSKVLTVFLDGGRDCESKHADAFLDEVGYARIVEAQERLGLLFQQRGHHLDVVIAGIHVPQFVLPFLLELLLENV